MKRSPLVLLPLLVALGLCTAHCDGDSPATPAPVADAASDAPLQSTPDAGSQDSAPAGKELPDPPDAPLVRATKVDLLFVVDNSASMGDKQALLASSVGRVIRALPVKDIHVGVISSSLANGGDICDPSRPRRDDRAHLLNASEAGAVVAGAEGGFLQIGPGVPDLAALEAKTAQIVRGVGQSGCGHEAPLEAMYRFVAQPDPPDIIRRDAFSQAELSGIDVQLLAQRKAFFRPDSAVGIIMLTDEDDASIDPRAIGGFGYAFSARDFPGSNVVRGTLAQGKTAPRGTSVCANDPASPECTSCGFASTCDPTEAACQALKNDPSCKASPVASQAGQGYDGFYGPADDDLNVRMASMKQRFGVEPRYAIDRYVRALTKRLVPDRDGEHEEKVGAKGERIISDYLGKRSCTNPLFASNLPSKPGDERCDLPDNGRSARLVFFGLVGGVPAQLLAPAPDWVKILGQDPDGGNFTGIDPHMIVSVAPRSALLVAGDPRSPRGSNGNDPVHGREWDTQKRDLQYACTLALAAPRTCAPNLESCDCIDDGGPAANPPVCKSDGSAVQTRAKAYPTVRELQLARALGEQGVVASICAADAATGYGVFFDALTARMKASLNAN